MESIYINQEEYRLVTLRGRSKYISKHGDAINPYRKKQKATIYINPDGYPCFGGGIPVHLYVAYGWVDGYFDNAEVDHIDFNRKNYDYTNLRWVSHIDNIRHSSNANHYSGNKLGSANGRATFCDEEVDVIKNLFEQGYKTMDVIKILHPEYTYQQRKNAWSKYNRIKTKETWN